jgi:DNA-binding NarL/FixJ family response regulator
MRPYSNEYKNACDVLPEELVRKLQSIYTGPVWIPAVARRRIKTQGMDERDENIRELHRQGKSIGEITETVLLSRERVRQIIKNQRGNDG